MDWLGKTIKQRILNECSSKIGLSAKLAELGGYSSVGNLNKFLKTDRKPDNFSGYVQIVSYLFPDKAVNLLKEESLTVDPKVTLAKNMLVFLEMNKEYGYLRLLINRMLDCGKKSSQQWATIFETDLDYLQGKIDFQEAMDTFCSIKSDDSEMEVYVCFMKAYLYLDKQYYEAAYSLTINMDNLIKDVKEQFIRDTFTARLMLIQTEYNVRKGDVLPARRIALEMFNCIEDSSYKAWAALHLGNSYITESFDKADNYFNLGLALPNINNRVESNLKKSKTFNQNLWSKQPDNLVFDSQLVCDKHEIAHRYIRLNEMDKAMDILTSLENLTVNESAFNYYLRGLITNSMDDFCKSIKFFRQSGDMYFKTLSLIELSKLEINECLIDALA